MRRTRNHPVPGSLRKSVPEPPVILCLIWTFRMACLHYFLMCWDDCKRDKGIWGLDTKEREPGQCPPGQIPQVFE